ncbi:MAG: hypothetical protein WDW38_007512 [Sanguina aurantia]
MTSTLRAGPPCLQVWTGAEATLRRCWVRSAHEGICTMAGPGDAQPPRDGGPEAVTRLAAHDTKATGCRLCGVRVGRRSQVELLDCELSGAVSGLSVCGAGGAVVTAGRVRCVGNSGRGVRVGLGARVVMTGCDLRGNGGGSMCVEGAGTVLVLAGCEFAGQAEATAGGRVEVRGRGLSGGAAARVCAATWP